MVVEPPKDPTHGDMATNAAMVLAKEAKAKPRDLAEKIAERLREEDVIASVDIAGPGFINLTLKPRPGPTRCGRCCAQGNDYGQSAIGAGEKVNVEYVSANPTGPMHVGHCRGAVFGDALGKSASIRRLRRLPANITSTTPAPRSMCSRARPSCATARRSARTSARFPEGLYPGDYLKPVGQALAAEHGKTLLAMPEAEWLPRCVPKAIAMMMEAIKGDLAALNIRHDVFFSERSLIEGGNNRVARDDRFSARQRRYLRRPPAAAEGRAG